MPFCLFQGRARPCSMRRRTWGICILFAFIGLYSYRLTGHSFPNSLTGGNRGFLWIKVRIGLRHLGVHPASPVGVHLLEVPHPLGLLLGKIV